MQKWCPEAFESCDPVLTAATAAKDFQSEGMVVSESGRKAASFRSESGFATPQSLLGHLTQQERVLLFDLVEQDVAAEYAAREEQLRAENEEKEAALKAGYEASLENFTREYGDALASQLHEISAASMRLAVQLAEKIVRRTIELDENVLVRALETTQYRLVENTALIVSLNPVDAARLEARPDLLKELKITQINPDRRVEPGGCIIKAATQEWDATIGRQLETLGEIVEEAIATAGDGLAHSNSEEPHEPELG